MSMLPLSVAVIPSAHMMHSCVSCGAQVAEAFADVPAAGVSQCGRPGANLLVEHLEAESHADHAEVADLDEWTTSLSS